MLDGAGSPSLFPLIVQRSCLHAWLCLQITCCSMFPGVILTHRSCGVRLLILISLFSWDSASIVRMHLFCTGRSFESSVAHRSCGLRSLSSSPSPTAHCSPHAARVVCACLSSSYPPVKTGPGVGVLSASSAVQAAHLDPAPPKSFRMLDEEECPSVFRRLETFAPSR